jgi:hypothetical protein
VKTLVLSMGLAATAGGSVAPSSGRDTPVNGLRMYYEIHGGRTLIAERPCSRVTAWSPDI